MWYNRQMSYDVKYRGRALEYMRAGHSYREAAAVFKVSTTTLQKWKKQLKESGGLEAAKRKQMWRKIDPAKLRAYVAAHPDAYQHEMAEAFGVRLYAIQNALRILGITRKKNQTIPGKQ